MENTRIHGIILSRTNFEPKTWDLYSYQSGKMGFNLFSIFNKNKLH